MKPFWAIILIISVLGNGLGLYFAYRFLKHDRLVNRLQLKLNQEQAITNQLSQKMPKQLIFLHHSVGQGWLEGGGLKAALLTSGLGVHDATYGDEIAQQTDIVDWLPKFKNDIDKVFRFNRSPNVYYDTPRQNDIIMFKSCFPNSDIKAGGQAPGDASNREKTTWNYRAVFAGLDSIMAKYPDKLFIYVTAPPLVPKETSPENARRAREFNNWVKGEYVQAYYKQMGQNNLLVFDLFDILADNDNFLKKEYRHNDLDSHPNPEGGKAATAAYIEFLKSKGVITQN